MKNRIIIWGGNKKPLTLENLDSHASVSAFFLTKYLSRYYEIVNLVDMDSPEEILRHNDISAVLSTFQRGFTNRLILKGKEELFHAIRKHVKGRLCSIYDYNDNSKYYEDIIFTIRQTNLRNVKKIKKKSFAPNMVICKMGWCADSDVCCPAEISNDEVNVFIDHPPYTSNAPDCTTEYFKAFEEIKRKNSDIKLNVFHQNNSGIISWNFNNSGIPDKSLYVRKNKVPWLEIIEYYKKTHIFCITHPESACLSAIEAAMCGARLYVPKYKWNKTFIKDDLLKDGVPHSIFRCDAKNISSTFLRGMKKGFERKKNHQNLSKSNSWKLAAERIHNELTKCLES